MSHLILFFIYHVILIIPYGFGSNVENVENSTETTTTVSLDGRIVNGTEAVPGQFPYQISLRRKYNNVHFCGGTLIKDNIVLTAAHCMFINNGTVLIMPTRIIAVAGELLQDRPPPDHERYVRSIILHEKYNRETYNNDITLLQLEKPFKLIIDLIYPIPLVLSRPDEGTFCNVSGWGHTTFNGSVSSILLYAEVPIVNNSICQSQYGINPGRFCAGFLEGGTDACQGDSGGGLVCLNELAGIVSGGHGCAEANYPGTYTDVVYFSPWLKKKLNLIKRSLKLEMETRQEKSSHVNFFANSVVLVSSLYIAITKVV